MALSDDIARCADWLPGTIVVSLKPAAAQLPAFKGACDKNGTRSVSRHAVIN